MATITRAGSTQVITPDLVINYGYQRGSNNVVHETLDGDYPAVTLRRGRSRSGTLQMLFRSRAAAYAAETAFNEPTRFHFQEPATADGAYGGEDLHFVRSGPTGVDKAADGVPAWIVSVDFREVVPA